jgi:hypothetical protein
MNMVWGGKYKRNYMTKMNMVWDKYKRNYMTKMNMALAHAYKDEVSVC